MKSVIRKTRYPSFCSGFPLKLMLLMFSTSQSSGLRGQPVYQFQYPFAVSPYAGAAFHTMLHENISWLENKYFPLSLFRGNHFWSNAGNVLSRMIRMGTWDFYTTYLPIVHQHEYFGHLARAKQLYAGFTRYEIYLFPPTGGRAYYGAHKYPPLTFAEEALECTGGMEATSILAANIQITSLQQGELSYQDAMLYLGAKTDFCGYVLKKDKGPADDISRYLQILNNSGGQDISISRRDLILPNLFSFLLDPYAILCLGRLVSSYLIGGETLFQTPSGLRVGSASILPYYTFEPSAEGPRHYLCSYLLTQKHLVNLQVFRSAFIAPVSYGVSASVYAFSLKRPRCSFDLALRYWHSSRLAYHARGGQLTHTGKAGALIGGMFYWEVPHPGSERGSLSVSAGICLKTTGYTKGYPLAKGCIPSLGIGYVLHKRGESHFIGKG